MHIRRFKHRISNIIFLLHRVSKEIWCFSNLKSSFLLFFVSLISHGICHYWISRSQWPIFLSIIRSSYLRHFQEIITEHDYVLLLWHFVLKTYSDLSTVVSKICLTKQSCTNDSMQRSCCLLDSQFSFNRDSEWHFLCWHFVRDLIWQDLHERSSQINAPKIDQFKQSISYLKQECNSFCLFY